MSVVTLAFIVALVIRYWWVIRLLSWPPRASRVVLNLAFWTAVTFAAARVGDLHGWTAALALVFALGGATEVYNDLTEQWRVGSSAFSAALHRDHQLGALAAIAALITLVVASRILSPAPLLGLVVLMVATDWVRLLMMIARHQRLLRAEILHTHNT